MAEPLLDAEYLARHAARRDGSMPPVEMTFEVTAPSAEPETPTPSAPAPDAATPPAEATGASIAAAATTGDAKAALEELLRKFGITQPLGEMGFLEGAAKSANVGDLVTRMVRGLDLGLQLLVAPAIGAGTALGDITQLGGAAVGTAAKAVGLPVSEQAIRPMATPLSHAAETFAAALAGFKLPAGPVVKTAVKGAVESPTAQATAGIIREDVIKSQRGALGPPAKPTGTGMPRPGTKLGPEYVYHNTKSESLAVIEREGFDAGAFSDRPIDFGGDVWIAARKSDLPNVQTHRVGTRTDFETSFENMRPLGAEKLLLVDKDGRVIRSLDVGSSGGGPVVPSPPKPKRPLPIRAATAEEAKTFLETDASTLKVGDKMLAIQWGEMASDEAIADTIKKLRHFYTEKKVFSIEKTQEMAQHLREMGFEDQLLSRAFKDGKVRAEAQATFDIIKKGMLRMGELRERMRDTIPGSYPHTVGLQEFQVQLGINGRFIQHLDDMLAEAGGTMRIAQEAAQGNLRTQMNWMRRYATLVQKGLLRDIQQLPELWDALPRPEQQWQFARLASKHGWDILRELIYDSMLFTVVGQLANIVGNTIQLKRPVDLVLATGIGQIRSGLVRSVGGTPRPTIPLRQAYESGHGMLAALTGAHWAALETYLTGVSRFGAEFKSVQRAITGDRFRETLAARNIRLTDPLAHALDWFGFLAGQGNRALAGADEWYKMVQYSGRSYEMAVEEAIRQQTPAKEIGRFLRQWLQQMPDDAKHVAAAFAHHETYTEPLTGTLKYMNQATDSPVLVGFIPFFKTLANVVKVGFEHLPGLNMLVKRSRDAILAGGPEADLALARVAEGTALAITGKWLFDAGKLTGRRPDNRALGRLLEDMGWQEDAWVFYDEEGNPSAYLGINRLDPANQPWILMSHIGSLMQEQGADGLDWDTQGELAVAAGLALGEYMKNISMMRGVKDALETFTMSDLRGAQKRQAYLARRVASLAVPSAIGQLNRGLDPYLRDAQSFSDQVRAKVPFLSTGLYPQRKLNGEPRARVNGAGPVGLGWASPYPYTKAQPDPVSVSMVQNGMRVTYPSRVIMGSNPNELVPPNPARDGIKLTSAQFDLYQRLAGNELKLPSGQLEPLLRALGYDGRLPASRQMGMWDILTAVVDTDFYKTGLTSGSPSGKEKVVLGIMAHFRHAAISALVLRERELLGAAYDPTKDFRAQYFEKKLSLAGAVGGPAVRQQAERALQAVDFDALAQRTRQPAPAPGPAEGLIQSLGR